MARKTDLENLLSTDNATIGKIIKKGAVAEIEKIKLLGEKEEEERVVISKEEYDRLCSPGKKTRRFPPYIMNAFITQNDWENYGGEFYEDNLFANILKVTPAAYRQFYLLMRNMDRFNVVVLPTDGMTDGEKRYYLQQIRELIRADFIKRINRSKVLINPCWIIPKESSAYEVQKELWMALKEKDDNRRDR